MQQIKRCYKSLCTLLVCNDGFAAYPNSIQRAFREKVKNTAGIGRCSLAVWKDLHIGTVIKRTVHMHQSQSNVSSVFSQVRHLWLAVSLARCLLLHSRSLLCA